MDIDLIKEILVSVDYLIWNNEWSSNEDKLRKNIPNGHYKIIYNGPSSYPRYEIIGRVDDMIVSASILERPGLVPRLCLDEPIAKVQDSLFIYSGIKKCWELSEEEFNKLYKMQKDKLIKKVK